MRSAARLSFSLLFVSLYRAERRGSRAEGVEYRFNASPVYTFDVERGQRAVKKQRLRTLLLPLLPLLLLLLHYWYWIARFSR